MKLERLSCRRFSSQLVRDEVNVAYRPVRTTTRNGNFLAGSDENESRFGIDFALPWYAVGGFRLSPNGGWATCERGERNGSCSAAKVNVDMDVAAISSPPGPSPVSPRWPSPLPPFLLWAAAVGSAAGSDRMDRKYRRTGSCAKTDALSLSLSL